MPKKIDPELKRSQAEMSKEYNKENTVQFNMRLNKKTDLDCIELLNRVEERGQAKADYIKTLMRKDARNRFPDINVGDIKNNS